MTIRIKSLRWALLIVSAALMAIPNVQSKPAKKKAKTIAAEESPAPEGTPSL